MGRTKEERLVLMIQPLFNGMLAVLVAKFIINDLPHAAGLLANPRMLSKEEFERLPIAYRGYNPEDPEVDPVYVTPDIETARSHGTHMMTGRVLPGKLSPDPEIEGFEARRLTGLESFNSGSAIVPLKYYYPDDYRVYMSQMADHRDTDKPTPGQLRYIASLCQRLKIATPHEERVKSFGEAGRLIRELEAEVEHRKRMKG